MCSATQTRPRSTSWWMRLALVDDRREAPRRRRCACSGARICVFHDARSVWSCSCAKQRARQCRAAPRPAAPASAATARAPRAAAPAPAARGLPAARRWAISPASSLLPSGRLPCAKKASSASTSCELVAQAQLDVDALDALGVLAHARQRDHHVLVDLEGVGVLADGRGALAVEPELLARVGADGDEALAARGCWRCAPPRWWRAPPRRRRRRRCRRPAPSSAGRRACSWWRSPPPSGSGRPGAPGRPGWRRPRFASANMKSLISTMRRHRVLRRCRRTPGTRCACAPACGARPSARW